MIDCSLGTEQSMLSLMTLEHLCTKQQWHCLSISSLASIQKGNKPGVTTVFTFVSYASKIYHLSLRTKPR